MMTEKEYIEAGLSFYGGIIDTYLFEEITTHLVTNDNPILAHIMAVLSDIQKQAFPSPSWKHAFRKELMIYLEEVLSMCYPIVKEYYRQNEMIEQFRQLSVYEKMQKWELTYATIRNHYSHNEIDGEAYSRLILEADRIKDIDAIWNVFEGEWANVNLKKKNLGIERLLEKTNSSIITPAHNYGERDYRIIKEVEDISKQYPILNEIVQVLGRNRQTTFKEDNPLIQKFQPAFVSDHIKSREVEAIYLGDNLSHLIASDMSLISDTGLEELFYYKYATKSLMHFSNEQKTSIQSSNRNRTSTRANMGPIVVCVDTSGSMTGHAEKIAKCMLLQLLEMAKSKKRRCYLISFSVRAQAIDLGNPNNWRMLNQFINNRFTGGTNAEEMLNIAFETLKQKDYSLADILIISDFIFPLPRPATIESINIAHKNGTRFYGLKTGNHQCSIESFLTYIWSVNC